MSGINDDSSQKKIKLNDIPPDVIGEIAKYLPSSRDRLNFFSTTKSLATETKTQRFLTKCEEAIYAQNHAIFPRILGLLDKFRKKTNLSSNDSEKIFATFLELKILSGNSSSANFFMAYNLAQEFLNKNPNPNAETREVIKCIAINLLAKHDKNPQSIEGYDIDEITKLYKNMIELEIAAEQDPYKKMDILDEIIPGVIDPIDSLKMAIDTLMPLLPVLLENKHDDQDNILTERNINLLGAVPLIIQQGEIELANLPAEDRQRLISFYLQLQQYPAYHDPVLEEFRNNVAHHLSELNSPHSTTSPRSR